MKTLTYILLTIFLPISLNAQDFYHVFGIIIDTNQSEVIKKYLPDTKITITKGATNILRNDGLYQYHFNENNQAIISVYMRNSEGDINYNKEERVTNYVKEGKICINQLYNKKYLVTTWYKNDNIPIFLKNIGVK